MNPIITKLNDIDCSISREWNLNAARLDDTDRNMNKLSGKKLITSMNDNSLNIGEANTIPAPKAKTEEANENKILDLFQQEFTNSTQEERALMLSILDAAELSACQSSLARDEDKSTFYLEISSL